MSTNSTSISFEPSHRILNQPCTKGISWDDGKEIRIYNLGPGNVLQEYAYSANKGWYEGDLRNLKIVLDPTSTLAAIRSPSGRIRVYYQDPNDDFIRGLYQLPNSTKWRKGGANEKAVKGSSIAIVDWVSASGLRNLSIFYQDPELHLRNSLHDFSKNTWDLGKFNPGVQPHGTPISVEVVRGGGVDLNVMWRDARGRVVSSSWSISSGWDYSNIPNDGNELPGRSESLRERPPGFTGSVDHPLATVSWDSGKEIRIYYLDSKRTLQEHAYSEKRGRHCWYFGDLSKLQIVLSPDSVIAAIQFDEEIRIYYQDGDLGIIQEICKPSLTDSWVKGAALAEAATASNIAAIGRKNNGTQIRVYYQDSQLRLQERCYDNEHWKKGTFNSSPQPRGTPIMAEVTSIGDPGIQVTWKAENGRFVSHCCDWDPLTEDGSG